MTEKRMTLGWIKERYEKVVVPFGSREYDRWGAYNPDTVTEGDINGDFVLDFMRAYPGLKPYARVMSLTLHGDEEVEEEVEVMSFPFLDETTDTFRIMARRVPGDPTTLLALPIIRLGIRGVRVSLGDRGGLRASHVDGYHSISERSPSPRGYQEIRFPLHSSLVNYLGS